LSWSALVAGRPALAGSVRLAIGITLLHPARVIIHPQTLLVRIVLLQAARGILFLRRLRKRPRRRDSYDH
jgi:hypothetical protein